MPTTVNIYSDKVALGFCFCCNYSQEILSNALSDDYTKNICKWGETGAVGVTNALHASVIPVVLKIYVKLFIDFFFFFFLGLQKTKMKETSVQI